MRTKAVYRHKYVSEFFVIEHHSSGASQLAVRLFFSDRNRNSKWRNNYYISYDTRIDYQQMEAIFM